MPNEDWYNMSEGMKSLRFDQTNSLSDTTSILKWCGIKAVMERIEYNQV